MKKVIRKILAFFAIFLGFSLLVVSLFSSFGVLKLIVQVNNLAENSDSIHMEIAMKTFFILVLFYFSWLLFKAAFEEFRKNKNPIENESIDANLFNNSEEINKN